MATLDFESNVSRHLAASDHSSSQVNGLKMTILVNIAIFLALIAVYEACRRISWASPIFFKRTQKRALRQLHRAPPGPINDKGSLRKPLMGIFGWLFEILEINEDELLHMIGLDGYVMIRYLNACFRIALFSTFLGILVLVPIYSTAGGYSTSGTQDIWNRCTLANVSRNSAGGGRLWAAVVCMYLLAAYYCQTLHSEYRNFLIKRLEYLVKGDLDTPAQAYYTIMIEQIPSSLRSASKLKHFFSRLFPEDVYWVEIPMDLHDLEHIVAYRRNVRNKLEKVVAIDYASDKYVEQLIMVPKGFYDNYEKSLRADLVASKQTTLAYLLGYEVYNAIDHYNALLRILNSDVKRLQDTIVDLVKADVDTYLAEEDVIDVGANRQHMQSKLENIIDVLKSQCNSPRGKYDIDTELIHHHANGEPTNDNKLHKLISKHSASIHSLVNKIRCEGLQDSELDGTKEFHEVAEETAMASARNCAQHSLNIGQKISSRGHSSDTHLNDHYCQPRHKESKPLRIKMTDHVVERLQSVGKEAMLALRRVYRGVFEVARVAELLTFGANPDRSLINGVPTSSTAFVTFKTRVAKGCAKQVLLSHKHYDMIVKHAPNPRDIIWENITIPQHQINMRDFITNLTLGVGAVFWSIVVGFITAISNMDSIAQTYPWLQKYQNTVLYALLNNYLALVLLVVLLALLPVIFDVISRTYEGLKLESEIQNTIMTRYFYYQLANVFVSLGLGSFTRSFHSIIEEPREILSILGVSLPSFSIYFTGLIITKTFTSMPIEVLILRYLSNEKKITRRELRAGPHADSKVSYASIYPNILMVLMILCTYACIAPLLTPFACIYFVFAYTTYKYQLLYVYIHPYQSGGFMWYSVFDRSMISLLGGVLVLLCYLLIRETTGPFYTLLPLPFMIGYFWRTCKNEFVPPSEDLTLDSMLEIDLITAARYDMDKAVPQQTFSKKCYRQPALAEKQLRPAAYRTTDLRKKTQRKHSENTHKKTMGLEEEEKHVGVTSNELHISLDSVAKSIEPKRHPIFGSKWGRDEPPDNGLFSTETHAYSSVNSCDVSTCKDDCIYGADEVFREHSGQYNDSERSQLDHVIKQYGGMLMQCNIEDDDDDLRDGFSDGEEDSRAILDGVFASASPQSISPLSMSMASLSPPRAGDGLNSGHMANSSHAGSPLRDSVDRVGGLGAARMLIGAAGSKASPENAKLSESRSAKFAGYGSADPV